MLVTSIRRYQPRPGNPTTMSTSQDQDINAPSLIAVFPLHGAYPEMAIGLVLKTHEQACAAAETLGIVTQTPSDVNWYSSLHWFNQENIDNVTIFDLDAYSSRQGRSGNTNCVWNLATSMSLRRSGQTAPGWRIRSSGGWFSRDVCRAKIPLWKSGRLMRCRVLQRGQG